MNIKDEKVGKISSSASGFAVIFSILGGVCCWGPLLFSILGIGTSVASAASTGGTIGSMASFLRDIMPYRNYFLSLNIIGILLSFYFVYARSVLKKSAAGATAVSEGEACDCETGGSLSATLSKVFFFASIVITTGIFMYLYLDTGSIFIAWPKPY